MSSYQSNYAEKLKDPRWQRKRLEVLQRDKFSCKKRGSDDKTLHVHHYTYISGKEPWEYEIGNFSTLCYTCHAEEEMDKIEFNRLVHDLLSMGHTYNELYKFLKEMV